ncbi:Hypothetical predicted protein, partial [Paramuricea clavata]
EKSEIDLYENDLALHTQKKHFWYIREEAHHERVDVEKYWKTLHALHVMRHKTL